MNIDSTTDNLISPKELAKYLKISQATIYRLIERRKITFLKIGGSLRFSKSDIEEYLRDSRVEPIKKQYERISSQ